MISSTTETMNPPVDQESQEMTHIVIDSQWGPRAVGSLDKCLAFISDEIREQSESSTLGNPSSFRIKKVCLL
jgi:hypothetical protein